jgi:NAD(P)-dependent dehydrogenase (short-subunit alcohol dehydrogenase family)
MERGVTVITGAASGMGVATARRLLRPDQVLLLVDVNEDKLAAVRDDIAEYATGDDAVQTARVDVTDEAAVAGLAERVGAIGPFCTLAHAAGISPTMADWRAVIQVDLVGTAIMLEAFRPLARPGSVAVCWASNGAYMGVSAQGDPAIDALLDDPLAADLLGRLEEVNGERFNSADGSGDAYCWAKRGVIRLVRRQAAPWGKQGGRVVAISPGIVNTPMSRQEFAAQPLMQVMLDNTPVPRMAAPSEIADLVAFLASPSAAFITGTDVIIDGGCNAALGQIA